MSLEMLCVANADGYFVDVNPAWESVLGWTPAELARFYRSDSKSSADRKAYRAIAELLERGPGNERER